MKPVLTKSIDNFFQYIGGSQSLRTLKTFNQNRNLYKYRLSDYIDYIDKAHLIALSSLPCPTSQGSLDNSYIRTSKSMRSILSLPEEATCETCSFKTSCSEVNKPGTGRGNAADLSRFLYTWALEPPQEEKDLNSLSILLESFPEFIKKINSDPVPVKPEQENEFKTFKRTKKFEGMEEAGVEGKEKGGGRIRRVRD
jgi:hypothetical protein